MSVEKLMDGGEFKGLVVESLVEGETLHQYILNPDDATTPYSNAELGITFTGHFAVVTTDAEGEIRSLYIGDGDSLEYNDMTLTADPVTKAAYYEKILPVWQNSENPGWLEYSHHPHVYSASLGSWLYHPYDSLEENTSSWFYGLINEETMSGLDSSHYPYLYSSNLGAWLYHPYESIEAGQSYWFYSY